jgi:tRNA pseudouridine55 synthase
VLLIDKPIGLTSFGVVRTVRRLLGVKKVGHAGTLDPFASGLLIVCVARPATRMIEQFMAGKKHYEAVLQLGVETETLDPEGKVTATAQVPELDAHAITACLEQFRGPLMQQPPIYSALKHNGKPLYHYARKGIKVEKAPRPIHVYGLASLGFDGTKGQLALKVQCSRGTYIRVLAADIGRALGCGAHLIALRRTASGCFSVDESVAGEVLAGTAAADTLRSRMLSLEHVRRRLGCGRSAEATGGS